MPSYAEYNTDMDTITDIQFTTDDLASDITAIDTISHLKTSVIQSPDLSFSSEEIEFIKKKKNIH